VLSKLVLFDRRLWRPEARVREHQVSGQILIKRGVGRRDAEVA
jgi:hypothetical protein